MPVSIALGKLKENAEQKVTLPYLLRYLAITMSATKHAVKHSFPFTNLSTGGQIVLEW